MSGRQHPQHQNKSVAAGRHKEPETHLHNPPLQTGWLWRDEKTESRTEQQWTKTHVWLDNLNLQTSSLHKHYFMQSHGSQDSPMSSSKKSQNQEHSFSELFAPCHFSVLTDFKNTDITLSWIPHHYHTGMLHKDLIISPPTIPWEKQKPAPCIGSSGVVSKPSLGTDGCFAELTRPPAWPGTEIYRKGGKAPGQWSEHKFFSLLWEQRGELPSFIAAAFRSARTSHAESLLER